MLRGKWRRWLGELLILAALAAGLSWWQTRGMAQGEAPPFAAPLVAGGDFDLARFAGRPALVYFWATWCPVCRLELGNIDALARDYQVIGVAMQSGQASEVAAYLQEQGVHFSSVADEEGRLAIRYGVAAVPALFVLDGTGRIRFVTRGYSSEAGIRLRLWLSGI